MVDSLEGGVVVDVVLLKRTGNLANKYGEQNNILPMLLSH